MADEFKVTPSEFAQIPLDFVIGAPMLAVINAHVQAAEATKKFVTALADQTVTFSAKVLDTNPPPPAAGAAPPAGPATKSVDFVVPLLAITKIPSLRIDSMSLVFNYNISQVNHKLAKIGGDASLTVSPNGALGKLAGVAFTGSISGSRTNESTGTRNGSLEVRVNMSEDEMPAGLAKIMSALTDLIAIPPTNVQS